MTVVKEGQVSEPCWGQWYQAKVDLLVMAGMVVRASGGFLQGQVGSLSSPVCVTLVKELEGKASQFTSRLG